MSRKTEGKFYVYAYYDPRPTKDLQPIYIGKGTAALDRASHHWERRCANRLLQRVLDKLRAGGLLPVIEILEYTDDEAEAFEMERFLVDLHGRRDRGNGPLCNLTDGGEGGAGQVYTPERRAKLSASHSTLEARARNAAQSRANWSNPELRGQMIASKQRAQSTPEFRAKLRAAITKSRTEEVRSAIGEGARLNWLDPAYRARTIESMKRGNAAPVEQARKSAASRHMWSDPTKRDEIASKIGAAKRTDEARARTSEKSKEYYADEEKRRQAGEFAKAYNTPEVKAAKAAALAARWADPVWKANMLAARAARQKTKGSTG